jgi:molybdate transport system ATP-binding protein
MAGAALLPGAGGMIRFACKLSREDFAFDVAFEAEGGVTALFGPSGAGKSTAIRLLAGLERGGAGVIEVDGETLLDTSRGVFVPPHRRRIGLIFQDALLMPHLSVKANLLYGRFFTPRAARRIGFDPVVETLGIGHLLARRPATLSGGERQRVAIGRALLASPRLLLMDEPLASLDAARKREILPFIERLRDEFAIPIIYISHAFEEVALLARKVVWLEGGKVASIGPPGAEPNRADALDAHGGEASVLTARAARRLEAQGVVVLSHAAGEIVVPDAGGAAPPDKAQAILRVTVRAGDVALLARSEGEAALPGALKGDVVAIEADDGPFATVLVALEGGETLKARSTRFALDRMDLAPGSPVSALVAVARWAPPKTVSPLG